MKKEFEINFNKINEREQIQMTIKHIYKIVKKTMQLLEEIDFINLEKRKYNQEQVNKAYKVLDNVKDELIRENIKKRQGENK